MKVLQLIKKIIYSSAFVFTVTVFMFMAMFSIVEDNAEMTQTRAIPLSNYPWILLFSFIVGALDNMLTAKRLPLALRLPVHFVGVLTASYVIILRVFGLGQNGSGRFSVMMVASLVYAVVLGAAFVIRRGIRALIKENGNEIRKSITDKSNEDDTAAI